MKKETEAELVKLLLKHQNSLPDELFMWFQRHVVWDISPLGDNDLPDGEFQIKYAGPI
jgi:hypothetical protein